MIWSVWSPETLTLGGRTADETAAHGTRDRSGAAARAAADPRPVSRRVGAGAPAPTAYPQHS